MSDVKVRPIKQATAVLTVEGSSIMVQHKWSEKAKEMMRQKKAGRKTKTREVCNPEKEARDATYFTADGQYGIPVTALKKAIIGAAHKDLGIEKTLVRKSVFIRCSDPGGVLPIRCDEPIIREDPVRVGAGSADLRYRPQFDKWECDVEIEFDEDNLTLEDLANLINRAGFGVGILEFRPEKGGEWGRFRIKETS
jgi:hypothetical protein